jgi:hypothetical protein
MSTVTMPPRAATAAAPAQSSSPSDAPSSGVVHHAPDPVKGAWTIAGGTLASAVLGGAAFVGVQLLGFGNHVGTSGTSAVSSGKAGLGLGLAILGIGMTAAIIDGVKQIKGFDQPRPTYGGNPSAGRY